MQGRGRMATGVGLATFVAVGAALVAKGALTNDVASYRGGVGTLLVSLALLIIHRSHCNTTRLIQHQTNLAALAQHQRQEWAEHGYRAGKIDTQPGPSGAHVVPLRPPTAPRRHRDGA